MTKASDVDDCIRRMDRPNRRTLAPIRLVPNKEAVALLGEAYVGGKNKEFMDSPPRMTWITEDYVLVDIPLSWIRANEDGERYDATVDLRRARRYATLDIDTPVSLRFGVRSMRDGHATAWVADGGHRVSGRRLTDHQTIRAMLPASDFRNLVRVRETAQTTR